MAEAYCACIIANLEGMNSTLAPQADLSSTLDVLDRRTRRLEARSRIAPPPPMLDVSWDSLTFRVCRLSRRITNEPLKQAPPLDDVASLPLLKSVIATINGQSRLPWSEKEDLEEEDLLRRAAQWLCFYAGQRGFQIKKPTFKLGPVCSLALDLALETETGFPIMRTMGYHPRPPGAAAGPVIGPRAACCGCCSCSCHKNPRSSSPSSVVSIRARRKGGLIGWIRKLAFWRRKRITDDGSSTSGTVVSDN
ncbi:hypothetical protein F4677DRAFT_388380 [Hypoxylon crocopeplum]|nr:hypothetical protein F4677DRAFT_388380 [Hypoxylon crocopeplum]